MRTRICCLLFFALVACAGDRSGDAKLNVALSNLSGADVASVTVTVDGPGMTEMQTTLDKIGSEWHGTLTGIPAGADRVFTGVAADGTGAAVFRGQSMPVAIVAGQTAVVVLDLEQINAPPSFSNHAPHINSIFLSSDAVGPGDVVHLAVGATDADGDVLGYQWIGPASGTFTAPRAATTDWSMAIAGTGSLTINVSDPHGAYDAVTVDVDVDPANDDGAASIDVSTNAFPEVQSLIVTTGHLQPGQPVTAILDATDPDGDALGYTWSDDCGGSWNANGDNTATYTLPIGSTATSCTLRGDVSDGRGGTNFGTLAIEVNADPQPTHFSFSQPADYAAGVRPYSVAIGDLNGDGKPDLAVATITTNDIVVYLADTAPGTFTPGPTIAAGATPLSVAIGDINADGKPDLAFVDYDANYISVALNTTPPGATQPTFSSRFDFASGTTPNGIAFGDFNRDGKPDLAVANYSSETVSVLLNMTGASASTPTFAAQQQFATGAGPVSVAVGDFNADGAPDLAVADILGNSVSVLLNTTPAVMPTASFAPYVEIGTGSGAIGVAIGDLNGDGKPDLAVACGASSTVAVLLDTTTTFAASPTFTAPVQLASGANPNWVAIGDLNGDGKPDLATANHGSTTISVLRNVTTTGSNGASFDASVDFTTGSTPAALAIGDLNADGKLDLAVANETSNTLSVLLAN